MRAEQWLGRSVSADPIAPGNPADLVVFDCLDARSAVAELRAGLPPTLAVAGSYLDGIGVPACIGAAGRAVTSTIKAVETSVAR